MIYDKLSNINNYLGMNQNLDTAIGFIASHDLSLLPLGKTSVLDDAVYINVMEAQTAAETEKKFELHKEYMDIQIDLAGTEIIQTGDSQHMLLDDYNSDTDFGSVTCNVLASCTMGEGNFIVCMPGEPHKPGICVQQTSTIKKCVFKVHK